MAERTSPLAPTMAQAIGFNDRRWHTDPETGAPEEGTLVESGHAKHSMADPSMGTANVRPHTMEAGGANFRVTPQTTMPNVPYAAATQANGRIVPPSAAVSYDKDYTPDTEAAFEDAPVVGDVPAGSHRIRGYTQKQG